MRKAARAFSKDRRIMRKGAMTKWHGSLQARGWASRRNKRKSFKRFQKYKVGK